MAAIPMIKSIDHFVITVADLEATLIFYERVLGLTRVLEPGRPAALTFGSQKINVHQADRTFDPKARQPTLGRRRFLPGRGPAARRDPPPRRKPGRCGRSRAGSAHRRPRRDDVDLFPRSGRQSGRSQRIPRLTRHRPRFSSAAPIRSFCISVEPSTKPAIRAQAMWRPIGWVWRKPSAPMACRHSPSRR